MIDLKNKVEDIVEIYIDRLGNTDKTVGVIVNKDFAEYIMKNILTFIELALDETNIKQIDLVNNMDINEYLVSVDGRGAITVVPIKDFVILNQTDVFYIDMDGDISQKTIDYCINEDKEVILFGQVDEDDECDGDCENCSAHETELSNDRQYVERYSFNGKEVDKATYDEVAEKFHNKYMESVADMLLSYCEFMDEIRKIG